MTDKFFFILQIHLGIAKSGTVLIASKTKGGGGNLKKQFQWGALTFLKLTMFFKKISWIIAYFPFHLTVNRKEKKNEKTYAQNDLYVFCKFSEHDL